MGYDMTLNNSIGQSYIPAPVPVVFHQSSCTLLWSTLEQNWMKDGMVDFSSSPRLIIA